MKNKIIYISIICAVAILGTGFFVYKSFVPEQVIVRQKCPDDYGIDDAGSKEYLADFDKWTNNFYNTHPGATLLELSEARYQFWVDNNCTAALQRYKDAKEGRADPKSLEQIENIIRGVIDNSKYYSELGFSFNYPSDMSVMSDPEDPHLYIIPDSYKGNDNETLTAVVISAMLNDPQLTPLEWLNGPNSGADMSKGYSKIDIDGQEAIVMNDGAWIVVNTPDNKRQLSIATLPSQNPSETLKAEMSSIVKSIIFDK
ncbi:MAG: hypothetical protein A2312_02585 [Candidatus Staskawiczbacteria bacterium RIFOXYB2_FULL_32_9]|uniref:Uncharacterized protein n=1 Tax=Candidatus Staskawiczbacteria bacterium RIFOXYD1_FULL_32_13 TaxID=1802234 RepID=A0A1G2JPW9_9BACT|nr:MAG: hypothetical protein UR22_C0019G0002 [Parcubacteria group bacterium GW2011_GWC2_32_10]OGZ79775.1 MAG: hypothetical protein A2256_03410 [Candidatus Staskawiczbacteria bacterium RIFOXYA2_FULL_32_7]OGZ80547.1 MAG: hypothetical protein A2360_03305 [Candidatus Staskawiczbacteria bacterium RIFOXYB1_FULL_32_11]OGZ81612.1 MAG: hypothetical protein A2312_02585 [Candidatus Staskawiczbacteria bacterium RIFOXYB2_FULL_32_9]OGZ87546.1 MAG: hypothetical protein A2463_03380 [Candidatus Staskawiczbacter